MQTVRLQAFRVSAGHASLALHPDTKPAAAGPPDHLLELPADAGAGILAKTQLHLAIAQDGLNLRISSRPLAMPIIRSAIRLARVSS